MSARDPGPKLFVLDTNVILHDAGCIRRFADNDVAIPITVLEELDHFKRGFEDIHLQGREFLRQLDALTGDIMSEAGVALGEGLGSIRVVAGDERDPRLRVFATDTPDHRILNTALVLQARETKRPVILVTKDTNLRLKAKSLGLTAQDYNADKVQSFDALYTGKRVVEGVASETIAAFYEADGRLPQGRLPAIEAPVANENFIVRNCNKSVLVSYRAADQTYARVPKLRASGITPRNADQSFALRALLDDDLKLVTLTGTAGSGKTLLALAAALELRDRYRQILLARPIVPLSNRELGFLPGDVQEKIDPYMQPLYDNLSLILTTSGSETTGRQIEKLREVEKLVITPLAYIRGRSLQRSYFIVDEAQNLTPHEVKTVITRAGEGTKVVLTGDIRQIDQPYLDSLSNGLSYVIHRMVGQPIYGHVTLDKGERSPLADMASRLL